MLKSINLFGGPGVGKSVTRARLFSEMKMQGFKVEEVHEYAKDMVYEDRYNILNDQLYLLAKQNRKMKRLEDKVDYCITDSPLLLNYVYLGDVPYAVTFTKLLLDIYRQYDNINIYLERDHAYQEYGRYHNEQESIEKGEEILIMLESFNIPYTILKSSDPDLINKIIKQCKGHNHGS